MKRERAVSPRVAGMLAAVMPKYEPVSAPANDIARVFNEATAAAVSQGSSQVHVSGGVGWTVTPRLELNVGADFAKRSTLVSTSLIVHLGRTP